MLYTVSEVVCPLPERHTLFATLPKVVKKLSLGNPKVGRRCYFGDLIIRFLDLQEILSTSQQPGPTSAQDSPHSPCFCGVGRGWCRDQPSYQKRSLARDRPEKLFFRKRSTGCTAESNHGRAIGSRTMVAGRLKTSSSSSFRVFP